MNQQQVLADFRRRYERTYIFVEFPNSQKEELFHVDSIEESESTVGIMGLSSRNYGKIQLNFATDHRLLFKYPPVGVFQNGPEAFLFRRLPKKQYSRGICAENSEVRAITGILTPGVPRTLTFETVENAFIGKTYPFQEALKLLGLGKHKSVALTDNFSLSLSPTKQEGYLMWFFDCPVAWIDTSGKLLLALEETFNAQIKKVMDNG